MADDDQKALEQYLASGGQLLLALDPGEAHGMEPFLLNYGVHFENTFLKMPDAAESAYTVFVHSMGHGHSLSKSLSQDKAFWHVASSLTLMPSENTKGLTLTPVLRYEKKAEVMDNIGTVNQKSIPRAVALAGVIVESKDVGDSQIPKTPMSLLVLGDSDVFTNQLVSQPGNFSMVVNLMNYLSHDRDILALPPRRAPTTYLLLSQTDLNFYVLFMILPLPFLLLALALFVRLRRAF